MVLLATFAKGQNCNNILLDEEIIQPFNQVPTALVALDDETVIIGYAGGAIARYNVHTGLELLTQTSGLGTIRALAIENGELWVQSTSSSNIHVFNLYGNLLEVQPGVRESTALTFSSEGQRVQGGNEISFDSLPNLATIVVFNPDGTVSYAYDTRPDGAEEFLDINGLDATDRCGGMLAIAEGNGDSDDEVVIFDNSCNTLDVIPIDHPVSVGFYLDLLYVLSADGTLRVLPARDCGDGYDETRAAIICTPSGSDPLFRISIAPNGDIWAITARDGRLLKIRDSNRPNELSWLWSNNGQNQYGLCWVAGVDGTYAIERSVNGASFEIINTVTVDAGNVSTPIGYVDDESNTYRVSTHFGGNSPVWCSTHFMVGFEYGFPVLADHTGGE